MSTAFISYKNILSIALPIMIGGLSMNVVELVDTIFISQLGEAAIGGAGNAIIFFFTVALTGFGLSSGVQIFIGRENGAENYLKIGRIFGNGLVLMTAIGILCISLLLPFVDVLGNKFVPLGDARDAFDNYLTMRIFGLPFVLMNAVFMALCVGTTRTKIIIPIMMGIGMLNVGLDYLLIFGFKDFEGMGVKGAALASNLSNAVGSIVFLTVILGYFDKGKYAIFSQLKLSKDILQHILKLGAPLMLQNFLSIGAWLVFFAVIARMSTEALAISHILRSLYIFVLMPVFSLCDTSNTGISNLLGMGRRDLTRRFIGRLLLIGLSISTCTSLLLWAFEHPMLKLYNATPELMELGHASFVVMLCAIIGLTIGFILFRAVSGTGKTLYALYFEIFAAGLYATYSLLGYYLDFELHQLWYVELLYFGALGLLSYFFLQRHLQWKTIRA